MMKQHHLTHVRGIGKVAPWAIHLVHPLLCDPPGGVVKTSVD
jgi:hypothetical protein